MSKKEEDSNKAEDSKGQANADKAVEQARKEAHEKLDKDNPEEKASKDAEPSEVEAINKRNEERKRQHELIDEAPPIHPGQNPPPGYPRIEVPLPVASPVRPNRPQ